MFQSSAAPTEHGLRGRKVVQNISRPFDEGFGTDEGQPESYRTPDPAPPPWQPPRVEQKSVPLAVVLAILVPGLGHMYCRRFAQGVAILAVVVALLLLFIFIITVVAAVFVWAWQVYDVYRLVRAYNAKVAETGARPW